METHKESPTTIKFVIKSIIPITSDFKTVLKSSNDSSSDNLLEFRSLSSDSFKIDAKNRERKEDKDESYSADVKNFIEKILSREKNEISDEVKDDSGCKSEENESSGSLSDLVITKKQKVNDANGETAAFATMASSTPIKLSEKRNVNLDISGIDFLSYQRSEKENFDDSDFESMEQDQYDESKARDDDVTLTNSLVARLSAAEFPALSRTSSLTDFKNGLKQIIEETVRRTPMALRKAFNMQSDSEGKKSKFLNIFSSTKKPRKKNSPGKKKHNRRTLSAKKKYPLTKENLKKYFGEGEEDKENLEWGENFDYSFVCEPASSVIDENDNLPNYISYNTSLDSSIELLKSPLVPVFRLEPPSDASSRCSTPQSEVHPACDYVRHLIKCSYASRLSLSTSLRRSMSEPVIDDDDASIFSFTQANTTKTSEASIIQLVSTRGFMSPLDMNEMNHVRHSR
jgi:hypothetical protein